MIREATEADLERLLDMGETFYNGTIHSEFSEYSRGVTENTFRQLMNDDSGILLVLDDGAVTGAVGGLIYPMYMTGDMTGQELFWWCENKGKGISLLNALEETAKELGATSFMMLSLDNMTPERLDRIYLKKGYKRAEHTYIKEL